MAYPHERAALIALEALHEAERGLEGQEVILTDGTEGIVHRVRLNDHHGLVFTLEEHQKNTKRQWFAVSRIREIVLYEVASI